MLMTPIQTKTKESEMKLQLACVLTTILLTGAANAQDDERQEPQREHGRPPEVAIDACAAAVQGDQCSFEGRRGETLEGTCEAPDDKPLACRPEGRPPARSIQQ
jgi:hypothetical protein